MSLLEHGSMVDLAVVDVESKLEARRRRTISLMLSIFLLQNNGQSKKSQEFCRERIFLLLLSC